MSAVNQIFGGLVQRNAETPQHVLDACFGWFNGRRSAMWRFQAGGQVKATALVREAMKALAEDNAGASAMEIEQLKQLSIWASRQVAMARAAQDLRDACEAFRCAVESLNLDPYTAEQVRREACGSAA